jgi:hypothetical protein
MDEELKNGPVSEQAPIPEPAQDPKPPTPPAARPWRLFPLVPANIRRRCTRAAETLLRDHRAQLSDPAIVRQCVSVFRHILQQKRAPGRPQTEAVRIAVSMRAKMAPQTRGSAWKEIYKATGIHPYLRNNLRAAVKAVDDSDKRSSAPRKLRARPPTNPPANRRDAIKRPPSSVLLRRSDSAHTKNNAREKRRLEVSAFLVHLRPARPDSVQLCPLSSGLPFPQLNSDSLWMQPPKGPLQHTRQKA